LNDTFLDLSLFVSINNFSNNSKPNKLHILDSCVGKLLFYAVIGV